jgi:phage virion morphogenesis protein
MSLSINIKVAGGEQVIKALARLALNQSDKARLFDEIGINLVENARLRFIDEQAPDGSTWKKSYRAANQNGKTLRDTGVLLASLTHALTGSGVEYGTNVPYAAPLHFGAQIQAVAGQYLTFKIPGGGFVRKRSVTLPARPFLGLDKDDEQMVLEIIGSFLAGVSK